MTPELLKSIGLTDSQAKTYLLLIEKGELTPPEASKLTGESRTNTYMILDKLADMELVERLDQNSKIVYRPFNPVAIEKLVETRRQKFMQDEQKIKSAMPQMLSYFYAFTEKPGIRLLQGTEGLKEIYNDTLRTKEDIYFLRTPLERQFLSDGYFLKYKEKCASLGIATHAYTPRLPDSIEQSKDDAKFNITRHWISEDAYTAPVEIDVYGSKTAFLSYGEEVMGVIVHSPTVALSMKQLLISLSEPRVSV